MIIYAHNLQRLSKFYEQALDLKVAENDKDFHRLLPKSSNLFPGELTLLQIPEHIASNIIISDPPEVRAATPIKPVFSQSAPMADVRKSVLKANGQFNPADTEWNFHENRVCDGVDPEGNVFQVRTLDLQNLPLTLRNATPEDLDLLEAWDREPHVIAAGIDGEEWQWETELARCPEWRECLIAMHVNKPIGIVQIIDPALEDSHYWGEVPANLRAIDIWLGEASDLGRGYGSEIMRQVLDRCFSDSALEAPVESILIDPLARNLRAHRFYEKLGFEFVEPRTFDDDECFVYRLTRARWLALQDAPPAFSN